MQNAEDTNRAVRLAYVVSHPIQYQTPLLRRIAQTPEIDLTVFFGSDFSLREYQDEGFGVTVEWDTPLLGGYKHEFLPPLVQSWAERDARRGRAPIGRGILRRLRRGKFDALWLHGYSSANTLHAMVAAKMLGIPVLLRTDSWLGDRVRTSKTLAAKQLFFDILRPFVDAALASGTLNAEYWRHHFGPEFPIFMLPYAVDNDYFQQRSREAAAVRAPFREELGLEADRPVVLFASKLQERKRCGDLIEAFLRLENISPRPYLLIVGDGEQRSLLEEQVRHAHRGDDIRFLGFRNQSELPRFFDLASVFVLPAQHEPWGLIVNEVMNAGRPVIVTEDAGCHPDLITNGVEGFVYPVGDIDRLMNCLHDTLRNSKIMGEHALKRISTWSFAEDIKGLRQALAALTGKIVP